MSRLLILIAIFFTTQSFALEFQGKFIQGHYIIGKTEPGSSIFIDKKKVKLIKLPVQSKNPLIILFNSILLIFIIFFNIDNFWN